MATCNQGVLLDVTKDLDVTATRPSRMVSPFISVSCILLFCFKVVAVYSFNFMFMAQSPSLSMHDGKCATDIHVHLIYIRIINHGVRVFIYCLAPVSVNGLNSQAYLVLSVILVHVCISINHYMIQGNVRATYLNIRTYLLIKFPLRHGVKLQDCPRLMSV